MLFREYIENGLIPGKAEQQEAARCLFRHGERADTFFYVITGKVGLSESTESPPVIVPLNCLVGLTDLMNENYSHTAIVLENAILFRILKTDLLEAIYQNPSLRLYLLQQMSRQSSLTKSAFE